jgi:pilus assembly protein Flp/PilA
MNTLRSLLRDEEGVTAIEYALIAALIAAVIVLAVTALGLKVNTLFETVTAAI